MAKDFGKSIVVTPTTVVVPVATEFTIQVASDGATTLTVLDGAAIAMDLKSKKSVIVKANQKLTVPKTAAGLGTAELQKNLTIIDPASLDRWWNKKPVTASVDLFKGNREQIIFVGGAVIIFTILIASQVRRALAKRKK
jgi:hypothetical protein